MNTLPIKVTTVILLIVLVFYFGYREWTDPILFPSGQEAAQEVEDDPLPPAPSQPVPPQPTSPRPEPIGPEVTESVAESVEEAFDQTYMLLARVMERHLESAAATLGDAFEERQEQMRSVNDIIGEAIGRYREQSIQSTGAIEDVLALVETINAEALAIEETLQQAREGWLDMFDDVAAMQALSAERLDAANYDFQEYQVKTNETLTTVVSNLQTEHNLPASDFTFLLNWFNELEYRLVSPGGRRQAYRVLANASLRVPIPKTTADMIGERGLRDKLGSQIAYIEEVSSSNEAIHGDLQRQVGKLREVSGRLQAIQELTRSLEEINLDPGAGIEQLTARQELSPELRLAWMEFQQASQAYRNAGDEESLRLARQSLDKAISQLLAEYELRFVQGEIGGHEDPLDYYLRFIEKFIPQGSN